jgi:hypothetical protein
MTNTEARNTEPAAAVAEPGPTVAPEKVPSQKGATRKKGAPQGQNMASSGKAKAGASKKPAQNGKRAVQSPRSNPAHTPRAEGNSAKILEMIGRPKGATLADIMKITDWQAHSIRGFLSTARNKHRIQIESSKNEAGERVYQIAK